MENDNVLKNEELSSELTGLNKGEALAKKRIIMIASSIIGLIVLMILIIIIVGVTSKNDENENEEIPENTKTGVINCIYDVKSTSIETILLSNEFTKNSAFDIEIDEQIVKYSKTYLFKNVGLHGVKFILKGPVVMDFMFKDVPDIVSISMVSEENLEIKSLVSAFEDCQSLYEIEIKGFNTSNVTSMKKLF